MANDMWRTPFEVVSYIENRFGTIVTDLCASAAGHVCDFYFDEGDDFLSDDLLKYVKAGELHWLNPPYSNPKPFINQAVKWQKAGAAVAGILNNDTSTKWFETLHACGGLLMPIVGGRVAFLNADGSPISQNNKPQIMFYMPPYVSGELLTDYVHIDTIYPNGKPKKNAVCKS